MEPRTDKQRIFFNTVVVNISNIFDNLIFFAVNVIIARYLNIEHFGEYTTALGYATFFSTFTEIGMNQALIRALANEKDKESEYFTNSIIIKSILTLIVYGVLALSLFFTNYNKDTIILSLIFGLVRIGNEYMNAFYAVYDVKEKFTTAVAFNTLFTILFLATVLIVVFFNGNAFHFAYMRLAAVVIILILLAMQMKKYFSFKFDLILLKRFIYQTIPFGLANIFGSAITRLNIIILSLIQGTIYSGLFNNAIVFINVLFYIPINLNRVLVPYLYKAPTNIKKSKYQFAFDIYSKIFIIISLYVFLIIQLFSKEIIIGIFSDKYSESISILNILAYAIPFIFSAAGPVIMALDLQKNNTRFIGVSLIVNIAANIIGAYYYKAEGVAFATVITYIVLYSLSHAFLVKRKYIRYSDTFKVFIKVTLITIILYFFHKIFLERIFYIYSFLIISLAFAVFVLLIVLKKDDIRIISETILKRDK